jgi:YVTN family beta-propeller protein
MPSLPKGVTKAIPVGLGPNGATFAFGSVWVADHHDGSVSRVDPKTGKTIATIPAGAGPGYVSPGFGSIWVTDYFENAISRINPKTNKSVHINLGDNHGPGNTGCSAIAAFGSVWVGDGFDVLRVDPAADKVLGATKVGHDPNALPCVIQQGGGLVWTHGPGNKIYGLDSKGRLAKVLPFVNITFGNGKEWVEQETPDLAGRVIALDPRTGKRLSVTSIAYPGDGVNDNMITSPGRVWIKNVTTSTLYGIDATTGRIVTKVDMNGLLAGMPAFAYGSVWLPIFDQNVLWTVDAS